LPPSPTPRSRIARPAYAAALIATATATLSALLVRFPPDRYAFYPRCPVATYLHLQCPGCGTTRALSALLHGHLAQALQLNPLTTLLIPILVLYVARHLWQQRHRTIFTWLDPPAYATYTLLAIAAIFTIARNLPT
jgi:hypothetical protein